MAVVEVSGEIDLETAPHFRAALEAAVQADTAVVIDMGGVTFMDSTGFGALVATHLQAKQAGASILLRAVSTRIRDLIEMLGLDAVLPIEPGDRVGGRPHAPEPGPGPGARGPDLTPTPRLSPDGRDIHRRSPGGPDVRPRLSPDPRERPGFPR